MHEYHRAVRNRQARGSRMRAAKSLGTHSFMEWSILFEQCGRRCVKCGAIGLRDIHKDHIVPVSLGGSDAIGNIQPLCGYCNTSKGADCIDYRPLRVAARRLIAIRGVSR